MSKRSHTTRALAAAVLVLIAGGCAPAKDRFERMMETSREGRDAETLALAREILADPDQPALVRARTEMTVSLAHIRAKNWTEARTALDRALALGIGADTGYFRDHWSEYDGWITEGSRRP